MKDLFGQAIYDYQTNNKPENLITETNISDEDEMDVAYLFRNFDKMSKIEQTALNLCFGNVLDVGCGAGSHALFLQNEKKLNVFGIDISEKAAETCKLRGLKNIFVENILNFESENNQKFDTILLLMNGTGIFGKINQIDTYLKKLKQMLAPNGQILIDSSDIIYMFDQDDDGAYIVPAEGYYGELTFNVKYKGETEKPFNWLYLDYNTLQNAAINNGFNCELICEGEHFDYLARLSL